MREKKTLPTIIFADFHTDSINPKILEKLVPPLKELGYKHFLNEFPNDVTLQDAILYEKSPAHSYRCLKKECRNDGVDLKKKDEFDEYLKLNEIDSESFSVVLHSYRRSKSDFEFYKKLKSNNINYLGIDLDSSYEDECKITPEMMKVRDKRMSHAFLTGSEPSFGLTGLMHINGIQNEILSKLSLEEASINFCFFYIYSSPPDHKYQDHYYDKDIREGKTTLPLEMITIDASEKSKLEIVDIIMNKIKEKQVELNEFNDDINRSHIKCS